MSNKDNLTNTTTPNHEYETELKNHMATQAQLEQTQSTPKHVSVFDQPQLRTTIENTRLNSQQLSCEIHLEQLPSSTKRIKAENNFLGQQRAKSAIEMAIQMPYSGYNIFAVGTAGLGKRTMIKRLLQQYAKTLATPSDWVYVNNFHDARQPIALRLNAGQAEKFQKAMHDMWSSILKQLERRFSTDSYRKQLEIIRQHINQEQQQALLELTQEGETLSLKLVAKNDQHCFVPFHRESKQKEEFTTQELDALPNKERLRMTANMQYMNKKLQHLGSKLGVLEDYARDQVIDLNHDIANQVVMPKINHILQRFEHVDGLQHYLQQYHQDIIEHVELILEREEEDFRPTHFNRVPARYQVNIITHHKATAHAPVIFEDFPTHYNLLGHVEQLTHGGTISTDFTLIRSGSLHQANGGFLIIEAHQLLEQPYAWQGLKRALRSGSLKLSSLEHMLTLTGSISLEPQAIPLNVKVILLAEPETYYELLEYEPELTSLFKVRADFSDTLPRTPETEQAYLHLIADYVQKDKLLACDRSALAALLQDSSRQAEDQHRLSLHASNLGDLIRESHHFALHCNDHIITSKHVQHVIQQRHYHLSYLRDIYWQELSQGTQLIQTQGCKIGQINALSVIHYADSEFGFPSRLTASAYQGNGEILDIERSVDLGGSLHAKGVLLMSSFLKAHLGRTQALHFSASLAFEQSYAEVDGDSATLAELCALLSAISQLPIDQSWAITGSMNQLGQVQPVGGINAKIEGFFDVCKLQGLTGKQGVIIPRQNIHHLMLRQEIIDAVAQQQFHIHAIDHISQALELVLAHPIGVANHKGHYEKHTIFAQVIAQLEQWYAIEHGEFEPQKKKRKKRKEKDKKEKKPTLLE